jgi:signal peptidase II
MTWGNATNGPRSLFKFWLALAALVVALDQLAKWLITRHLRLGEAVRLTGFFNIVRAHNSGAAFSFLAGAGGWQRWLFTVLALAVSAFIVWLLRQHAGQKLFALALCLILGGAVGNVLDRFWHGYVVDYLDFHWTWLAPLFQSGHFPAFNLADSAITAGAIGLVLDELRRVRGGR